MEQLTPATIMVDVQVYSESKDVELMSLADRLYYNVIQEGVFKGGSIVPLEDAIVFPADGPNPLRDYLKGYEGQINPLFEVAGESVSLGELADLIYRLLSEQREHWKLPCEVVSVSLISETFTVSAP